MYCFWRPKKFKLKSFKKPWRVIGVNSKGQGGRSNVQGVIGDYNVLGDRGNVRGVLSDGSLRSTAKAMGAVATSAVCLGLMMTPEGLFSFPAPLNGSFSLSAPPYDQFSFLAPLFGLFSFPAQPYRSMMALRDWWWLCEINDGFARSMMALRDQWWLCEIDDGRAECVFGLESAFLAVPSAFLAFFYTFYEFVSILNYASSSSISEKFSFWS